MQQPSRLPNISSELKGFRITSAYHIDRQPSIFGGYQYQKLKATDCLYYRFQYGYNPTGILASNQQAPNYDVNRVFIAYRLASSDEWSSAAGAGPDHSRTFWR